ncbi:hypothetical protein C7447_102637 [Tenacibaculum adriaticum]|uniref:Uncharacterized protein n=1 Tax=Tenacibaculum adriaticum TaxID=413713 RepID=A0A5S5DU57_9FLAO|nr:hypothetical protein [Tenacibaculum adriaticum]TYP99315.1 hypothetical protein C7447_102637 [Tenacibaculum adriaticum]
MKNFILPVLAIALVFTSCDIDQTKKTKLPSVDVDVDTEEAQLPEFDVDWADVEVGTTTEKVTVPKVVVVMEEVEVEVPYVDIDMPDSNDKEKRTLLVEAEVEGKEHELDIKKVYANSNNLVVVAQLTELSRTLGSKKLRISDQMTLNAPEDLNIKYYIVGERPNRVFNQSYKYFKNMGEVAEKLKGYKVIYSK